MNVRMCANAHIQARQAAASRCRQLGSPPAHRLPYLPCSPVRLCLLHCPPTTSFPVVQTQVIPIYGRGGNEDPRAKNKNEPEAVPQRPAGQRPAPVVRNPLLQPPVLQPA